MNENISAFYSPYEHKFVCKNGDKIYQSYDGETWTLVNMEESRNENLNE